MDSIQCCEAQSENMQLSSERWPDDEDLVTRSGVSMETEPEVVVPTQVIWVFISGPVETDTATRTNSQESNLKGKSVIATYIIFYF